MRSRLLSGGLAICLLSGSFALLTIFSHPLHAQERIRIAYVGPSLSNLPLLAAKELGTFAKNGLQAEILVLTSQLSAVALSAGGGFYMWGGGAPSPRRTPPCAS